MEKLKVVHIIPTLNYGGAERFVVDLVNNYSDDIDSEIIIFKDQKPMADQIENTNIHLVEKKGKISLGLFKKLTKKLAQIEPDIVHTHLFGADFWGRIAAKRLDLPVVTTEHNLNKSESWVKDFIKTGLRGYSDIYTSPSQAVKRYTRKTYKIHSKNIKVIRHGIPVEEFLHTEPYIRYQPLRLLMLGRLHKQKGHDVALKALKDIDKDKWKLDIVGEGGEYKNISKMIDDYGLSKNVQMWDPVDDVVSLYGDHDVVLVPSRWEGLGLVAMEAMASGRVVVASRVDGLKEFIENKETGILIEPENEKDLKEAVRFCLQNREKCASITRKARSYAKDNFSMDKMIESYEEVYKNLTS